MKVAKITVKDGRTYYTADDSPATLNRFSEHKVEIVEMTPEEYMAIPVTNDSVAMFS